MADQHICVAIYETHAQADEAFSRLEVDGFPINVLSLAGRDYWSEMTGSRHTKSRFTYRGENGPFWERLWANLPGWGVFYYFPDGPLLVAGSLARTIASSQENGDPSLDHLEVLNGVEAGLSGINIPPASIEVYKGALAQGRILLFIFGSAKETEHASRLLDETKAINHTLHHGLGSLVD